MSKRKTVVGVAAVREHYGLPKTRGRIAKSVIEQYETETGHKVETGFKAESKVTLRVTKVDAKGHKRTRKVEKSLAEVRALAGESAGKRGLLSAKAVAAAEAALSDPAPEATESE